MSRDSAASAATAHVRVRAFVLGHGVLGAWGGELAYVTLLGAALMRRFRTGQWQTAVI